VRDAAQEEGDPLRGLALEQVAGGAGPHRLEQVLVRPGRGQHDDLALRRRLADVRQRAQAVHPGHGQVEQDEARAQLAGLDDRLRAVGRLPDDVEPVLGQERGERFARERVIVRDEDAFHLPLIGIGSPAD
jgi:hypothetical protein